MRNHALLAVALCTLTLTCTPDDLTSPDASEGPEPEFSISDGAHGGTPGFFFLPPLVSEPRFSGDLGADESPVVEICVRDGTACSDPLATFTMASGDGSESIRADGEAGHYIVNWHIRRHEVDPGTVVRIKVLVEAFELGHVDVRLVRGGRNAASGNGPIEVNARRTLPIKFRIEAGAVPRPVAAFTTGGSSQAGSPTVFDASDSQGEGDLAYAWSFGDGRRGGGVKVSHIFASGGTFPVTLLVTNEFGLSDAVTQQVSISSPPPAAGSATITGRVSSTGGSRLSGVTVELVGGSSSATTDSDGEVTLVNVPTGITALLRLSKPGFAEGFLSIEIPASSSNAVFEVELHRREAARVLPAAEDGGSITGRDGIQIELPANALVDGAGAPVTGSVEVTLTPLDVSSTAIEAFPGNFTGVGSDGSTGLIQTFGVAEFLVTADGTTLDLELGETATIEIPIYTGGAALGDEIPVWSLDEATGLWVEEGLGTVVPSSESPTGLALRAAVSHLSWWNIDQFADPFLPFVRCEDSVGTGVECTVRGTVTDPGSPLSSATAVVPPEGMTLPSPPDVEILLEGLTTDGSVIGRTTIQGSAGATPEVVIVVTAPFEPLIRCEDEAGSPAACSVRVIHESGAIVAVESVPVEGRIFPLPPDVPLTLRGVGEALAAGEIMIQGSAGEGGEFVITLTEVFTPLIRCVDRLGDPTSCHLTWVVRGVGVFQDVVPPAGITLTLPPDEPIRMDATDLFGIFSASTVIEGMAGEMPDVLLTLESGGGIFCGGTPSSLATVIVTLEDPCSAPDRVGTVAEAELLVEPDGHILIEAPLVIVQDLNVVKPLTVEGLGSEPNVIDGNGALTSFLVNGVTSGSVVFRNLEFRGATNNAIQNEGSYDQVLVDASTFVVRGTSGVAIFDTDVDGGRVTVQNSTFMGDALAPGAVAVFSAGPVNTDVLNSNVSGFSFSGIQYQNGAGGRVIGNLVSDCGPFACIRGLRIVGFEVRGNQVTIDAADNVRRGIFVSTEFGAVATAVIADNSVLGTGGTTDRGSADGYALETGLYVALADAGATVEINGNAVSNAFEGIRIDGFFGDLTGTANQVDRTFVGIIVPSLSAVMVHESDFTDYVVPLSGTSLSAGSLTCNWWDDPLGPQNVPAGHADDIYTPWLTSPGGPCDGGL